MAGVAAASLAYISISVLGIIGTMRERGESAARLPRCKGGGQSALLPLTKWLKEEGLLQCRLAEFKKKYAYSIIPAIAKKKQNFGMARQALHSETKKKFAGLKEGRIAAHRNCLERGEHYIRQRKEEETVTVPFILLYNCTVISTRTGEVKHIHVCVMYACKRDC